ncbi:hypothetical protein KBB05_00745 [Patescibacteria group bacterium]|nr:hypothetical protein [Patescibacteria group bacterium]
MIVVAREIKVFQLLSIDQERSRLWIKKSQEKFDQRCLSGSTMPHKGDRFTSWDCKIKTIKECFFAMITKSYPLTFNCTVVILV